MVIQLNRQMKRINKMRNGGGRKGEGIRIISAPQNLRMGKKKPRFFKPVTPHNTLHLRLPPLFVQKYGKFLPQVATLRTSSGDTWKVELEDVAGEHRFGRGWSKFAADAGLSMGEMMEFCFCVDESTFDVLVFGINACGRHISCRGNRSPIVKSDPGKDGIEEVEDLIRIDDDDLVGNNRLAIRRDAENDAETDCDTAETTDDDDMISEEEHPSFEITLKKYHSQRLGLRKDIIEAAGLANEKAVVLEYPPNKRRWPILLYHHPTQYRIEMVFGWEEFRKRNGLLYGKTYLFEYVPSKNVIQVRMIK